MVALLLSGCTWPSASSGPTPVQAPGLLRLVSVADGDTFTVADADGTRTRIRLLGIDAPEAARDGVPADCGAREATDALRGLVAGAALTVTGDPVSDETDRFGRRLAYVTADGEDVALALVTAGMAEAWYPAGEPRPTRFGEYQGAEADARAARSGLWATCEGVGR